MQSHLKTPHTYCGPFNFFLYVFLTVAFPFERIHPKTAGGRGASRPGTRAVVQSAGGSSHRAVCEGRGEEYAKHAEVPRKVSFRNATLAGVMKKKVFGFYGQSLILNYCS